MSREKTVILMVFMLWRKQIPGLFRLLWKTEAVFQFPVSRRCRRRYPVMLFLRFPCLSPFRLYLPAEYRPALYQETVTLDTIRAQFGKVVNNMEILAGTWFSQPEICWIVPVVYEGMVVANIKIYYDGLHVVPDFPYYGL